MALMKPMSPGLPLNRKYRALSDGPDGREGSESDTRSLISSVAIYPSPAPKIPGTGRHEFNKSHVQRGVPGQ